MSVIIQLSEMHGAGRVNKREETAKKTTDLKNQGHIFSFLKLIIVSSDETVSFELF